MSLLLLWNGKSVPRPPAPAVATIQAGGGGYPGRRYERWEEQKAEQEAVVEEHGTQTPQKRVGKPLRLPPLAPVAIPAPPAPPVPIIPPDIERLVSEPIRPDDDEDAIVMLLEDL